jgi:hypothetical protein
MVLLDYWIPCHLTWLRPRRWRVSPEVLETSRQVAAGREVPPEELNHAQSFAAASWTGLMFLDGLLFVAQALSALLFPKGYERDLILNISLAWVFLAVISAAQMAMISWRAGWTGRHVLRTVRGMSVPPSLLRLGRPRRRDFWLMLIIAGGGTAGLFYGLLTHPTVR